jgi:SAM-dependent methyltransferase
MDPVVELQAAVREYTWYHRIELTETVYTESVNPQFQWQWDFVLEQLESVDFVRKRVLDVGCRDGLYSFAAERAGAAEVIGIDNDLSRGAVELLIPHFNSKVRMEALNLYDLSPERFGQFDIILFCGVLYHLRYPFWGLKKLTDCLGDGSLLLIESGMLSDSASQPNEELMFCPVERSPYEPTSCTFFNAKGLVTTLESMGLELVRRAVLPGSSWKGDASDFAVDRQFFAFRKGQMSADQNERGRYWDALHNQHSEA